MKCNSCFLINIIMAIGVLNLLYCGCDSYKADPDLQDSAELKSPQSPVEIIVINKSSRPLYDPFISKIVDSTGKKFSIYGEFCLDYCDPSCQEEDFYGMNCDPDDPYFSRLSTNEHDITEWDGFFKVKEKDYCSNDIACIRKQAPLEGIYTLEITVSYDLICPGGCIPNTYYGFGINEYRVTKNKTLKLSMAISIPLTKPVLFHVFDSDLKTSDCEIDYESCEDCRGCAALTECLPQWDACFLGGPDSECSQLVHCQTYTCNGLSEQEKLTCIENCKLRLPHGLELWNAYEQCLYCDSCPETCASEAGERCDPS